MRRLLLGLSLLATSAAAQPAPDHSYPVFFTEFSSELDSAASELVANAATIAQQFPAAMVTVTGYTDQIGSTDQEISLSKARADAVAALLQQDGVDASRITRNAVGTPPNSQPGVERRRVEIDIDLP